PQMDSGDGLSEEKHRNRVGHVGSRKLHAVGQFVRRNTLQEKLTGVSVFSFVAFERNSKKSNPNSYDQDKNDYRQAPPCQGQDFVVGIDLVCRHWVESSSYSHD